MDELPWQMIAILGQDMLHNLVGRCRLTLSNPR